MGPVPLLPLRKGIARQGWLEHQTACAAAGLPLRPACLRSSQCLRWWRQGACAAAAAQAAAQRPAQVTASDLIPSFGSFPTHSKALQQQEPRSWAKSAAESGWLAAGRRLRLVTMVSSFPRSTWAAPEAPKLRSRAACAAAAVQRLDGGPPHGPSHYADHAAHIKPTGASCRSGRRLRRCCCRHPPPLTPCSSLGCTCSRSRCTPTSATSSWSCSARMRRAQVCSVWPGLLLLPLLQDAPAPANAPCLPRSHGCSTAFTVLLQSTCAVAAARLAV